MIYLDYSANTPADPQVLDRFCSVERRCIGNANSHHQAGTAARAEIDAATLKIAALLGVPEETVRTRLSRARDKLKHILSEVPQYA
mgnify:CR=1 FL=1